MGTLGWPDSIAAWRKKLSQPTCAAPGFPRRCPSKSARRLVGSTWRALLLWWGGSLRFSDPQRRGLRRLIQPPASFILGTAHTATAYGCDLTEGYVTENEAHASR